TVFGVTLGNCSHLFYAGELDAWLARAGEPQLEDPERERFWGAVRAELEGEPRLSRAEAHAVERSISAVRVDRWAARRRLLAVYRRLAERLYRAVAREAHTPWLIDTSHYPLRARQLQELDGIDLFLIYLIRDPQSVVASFNRKDVAQYTKATLTTNVYLWLTNLLAVAVFRRQPRARRLVVRYEDFVADPRPVLREILERVNAPAELPDLERLRTGLAFQGNRLLRAETIALEQGPPRPPPRSILTTVMQMPWGPVLSRLSPAVGIRRS
ncbi:MAG: sulfotransferase, partial [Solirubrobacteraceae bacterium]